MLDPIFIMLSILYSGIFFALCILIIMNIDNSNAYYVSIIIALKEFVVKLFLKMSGFGILLSVISFIVAIPSMLMILLVQFIFWIIYFIECIWNLGNKKK